MKNGYENIMTSRNMRFFLFIVLVYFSQVSPFYYIHHIHENGLLEFEISFHPADVDVERSSEDQHDQGLPHTNDHQHTYDNQIDWNIVRTQSQRTLSFENPYIFSSISAMIVDDNNRSYFDYEEPPNIQIFETSLLIIRGPPLFS